MPVCLTAQVALRIFDWWFFVRIALEYDLGLARSYMAGQLMNSSIKYALLI